MNSIAAGMESDSGSDCDLVFSHDDPLRKSSKTRNIASEYVAIPAPSTVSKQHSGNGHWNNRNASSGQPKYQKPSNFHHSNLGRQSKWCEKRRVLHNSQPLDDLRYAVMQGNLDVVKDGFSKGLYIDVVLKSGWTALMYASSAAQPDIVLHLLENKADPNFHKDMFTSLMAVCASSSSNEELLLKCLRHLLRFGAKVNAHERHLTTPLMFAARGGHFELVKALLEAGATLDDVDNTSHTALSWAASEGHGIIVRFLLSKGADPAIVNFSGQTAADLAHQNGHKEVASLIERWIEQKGNIPESVGGSEQLNNLSKSQENLIKSITSNSVQKTQEKYFVKQGELELFLNGIGLSELLSVFKEQFLELSDVLVMNDEELEKAGVTQMGARKKILEASKATHTKEWEKSSLPNLSQQQYISCPDAVAMMANVAKHLKYISASVAYIRTQIQKEPIILELSQETASIHDLLDETKDSMKNAKSLDNELKRLSMHLRNVQTRVEYMPGDLITEPVLDAKKSALRRTVFFSFVAISITVILWKKPLSLDNVTSFLKSHVNFCFGSCDTLEPKCTEVLS